MEMSHSHVLSHHVRCWYTSNADESDTVMAHATTFIRVAREGTHPSVINNLRGLEERQEEEIRKEGGV